MNEERNRRAEVVRLIVTRRERAPRSPRMERALKRLIWRYVGQATPRPIASEEAPPGPDTERIKDDDHPGND